MKFRPRFVSAALLFLWSLNLSLFIPGVPVDGLGESKKMHGSENKGQIPVLPFVSLFILRYNRPHPILYNIYMYMSTSHLAHTVPIQDSPHFCFFHLPPERSAQCSAFPSGSSSSSSPSSMIVCRRIRPSLILLRAPTVS